MGIDRDDASEPPPSAETGPVTLPPGVAEMADQGRAALLAQFDGILLGFARQTGMELNSRYKGVLYH